MDDIIVELLDSNHIPFCLFGGCKFPACFHEELGMLILILVHIGALHENIFQEVRVFFLGDLSSPTYIIFSD